MALVLIGLFVGALSVVAPQSPESAIATHIRGGIITVEYHAPGGDHGTAEVHVTSQLLQKTGSTSSFSAPSVYRVSADGTTVESVSCTSNQDSDTTSEKALFDIKTTSYTLTGCFDTVDRDYIFTQTSSARISGISNADGTVQYEARLHIDGENDSAAPTFSSGFMYNIAYSTDMAYSTNMNGLGQGNSSVSYELVTEKGSGNYLGQSGLGGYGAERIPCSDFNTSTGLLQINSGSCTGDEVISDLDPGDGTDAYAFKVKASDSDGQYATRDVLLSFEVSDNQAPVFTSTSPNPGSLSVTPGGEAQTITVSATDADSDGVDFELNLSRSWIDEDSAVTTEGSGASKVYTKTYTLEPDADVNETVQLEISAFDDATFSLSTSIQYDIEAGGVLPPGTPGTPSLTPGAASLVAAFSEPNSGGTVASYRADATPTAGGSAIQTNCGAPPASPCTLSGLSPLVEYSVVIVAVNSSGSATSSSAVDTTLARAVSNNSNDDGDDEEEENPQPSTAAGPANSPRVFAPRAQTPVAEQPVTRQGPVLRNGVAPREVRTPEVRVGGVATAVESSVSNPSTLSVRAGTLSLGVQVAEDQGGVSQAADGTTEIGVSKGGSTNLSGSGLRPGSTVQVFLPLQGSNAKELTRIPVGEDGSFNGDASFATEPEDEPLPIGRQVMQMVSVDEDGNEVVVDMTVNVAQSEPTPELNRVDGVIPTMAPGASIATNAGVPEEVTVTAVEEQKLAVVEGDGWSMAVEVGAEDGGVDGSEGGASIKLVRDESAQVSGEGFMPGTRADVWLFSEPTLLGTVTIDDDGRFDGEMNIDGEVVSAGEHTLQMQGVGVDGYVRSANMGVVVDDSSVAAAEETAQASMAVIWWSLAGVIVLAAVVGLTIARRRQLF